MMRRYGKRLVLSCLALSAVGVCTPRAEAHHVRASHRHLLHHSRFHSRNYHHHGYVLQCVAFVKQSTNFKIHGNARDWWQRAAGRYARGNAPESGSVLSFRPTRRMPLGHVAVVRSQVDSRTILIDQSHWGSNTISRNVRVVDVSPNNDWTAVRVALRSNKDRLGSVYPTHGFIYSRPEGAAPSFDTARSALASNNVSMETASLPTGVTNHNAFDDDAPNRSVR
ncbi:CHAP domain-containing protein [Saccharibacter sp. 17.LH.SD]|uniref:CHAP domain-containing protein n=1 Tax=Saccharibacter sp. 17.LH.SD TaxID=2689393 RepID=UPI0013715FED|nr:CHAP domain-containing protein [Saccharibacter sp. 17.LH.SD]MXV43673.1 CHAP domain-containing protein [Saccharibacter sp. 17.LH.SD]